MSRTHDVEVGGRTFTLTATVHHGSSGLDWNDGDEVTVYAIHEGDRPARDEFHALLAASVPDVDEWWSNVEDEILKAANEWGEP